MDKHDVFIIDEASLIAAISEYGKGADSKDYEYAVSVYMKRKLEEIYKAPFCIVFDTRTDKKDARSNFNPTPEETNKILKEMLQEDTPVDFGLVKGTIDEHSKTAFAFQVKKFIGQSRDTFNNDLLAYINRVLKKYRPGEASLVVVPGLHDNPNNKNQSVQIDIDLLRKNIIVPRGSFQAVFILLYNNQAIIKQIWPKL